MGASVLEHILPFADVHVVKDIDKRCSDLAHRPRSANMDWVEYLRMMFLQVEGEPPTLESIARTNRVSPRTIDRHLRRENVSFRELLHQVRLERACELLQNSSATVAQIALQLGFSDAANFSRAFRRAIGISPAAYRERPEN
jgi:transcriptional regulator GlxA family with amidase domain